MFSPGVGDGSPQHSKMSGLSTTFTPPLLNRISTGAGVGPAPSDRGGGISREGTGHLISPGDSRRASSDGGAGTPSANGARAGATGGTGRRFSISGAAVYSGVEGLGSPSGALARPTTGNDAVGGSSSNALQTASPDATVTSRGSNVGGVFKNGVRSPLGAAGEASSGGTGRASSGNASGASVGNGSGAAPSADMGHVKFTSHSRDMVTPPGATPCQGVGGGSEPGPVNSVGVAGRVGPPPGRRVADQSLASRRPSASEKGFEPSTKGRDKSA
jgi:hypothetical protein